MSSRRSTKKVVIVGAGPGGLSAAMLLSHRGFDVHLFEKGSQVGGRNGQFKLGPYSFDIGPTFLMMKFLVDELFAEVGKKSSDYLEFRRLDPMYRLQFNDFKLWPTNDRERMKEQIEKVFPGESPGFDRFMEVEAKRFAYMYPCLQKDYTSIRSLLSPVFLRALPYLSIGRSLFDVLGDYFSSEQLKLSFTFQSKYLGMSPWECPGAFGLLPYIEHAFGVYHVMGGLHRLSEALARVTEEQGGRIHLSEPVKQLVIEGRRVKGVELVSGEIIHADEVIVNADFAYAMSSLVPYGILRKYSRQELLRREYSCSTFMLYLGLDRTYPEMDHHVIVFARNYRKNLQEILDGNRLGNDFSVYIRNASLTDPSLAPPGHAAVYVLVPVANNKSGIDWQREGPLFREKVIDLIESKTEMRDLRSHIKAELQFTPWDWENKMNVFLGATFNLSHKLNQLLYFRPRNQFEELKNCYLVGGGTHPGSGLPTILESGRITSHLICRTHHVKFPLPEVPQVGIRGRAA